MTFFEILKWILIGAADNSALNWHLRSTRSKEWFPGEVRTGIVVLFWGVFRIQHSKTRLEALHELPSDGEVRRTRNIP